MVSFNFHTLSSQSGLEALDQEFQAYLSSKDSLLGAQLSAYRRLEITEPEAVSEWIVATAPLLENFIVQFFKIENDVKKLIAETKENDPIFQFKSFYLQKAKRIASCEKNETPWLLQELKNYHLNHKQDLELSVAKLGAQYLSDREKYRDEIEQLIQWCVFALTTAEGRVLTKSWASLHLPHKKNYENLVPMTPVPNDPFGRFEAPPAMQRDREGFQLTDLRMSLREVLDEVHYCVYCHDNSGDFCSKGFPVKKNNPELGLKINPAGDLLTGCPLEEKISEMHVVKKQGFGIAALAIVTIDNPMCAATGHRICNDCMKACIYQKQDPVNIPQIETRVLTDVLHLPFGVEIYDLLIRWNPLRQTQFLPKEYNGKNVLVMGMGPAGFTLAHHLLMEGCAVVGFDGLKIEPLPTALLEKPIRDFDALVEPLDERVTSGFGGVAEYGITVRWDKNFLKLIYLSLVRRKYFQVFGNARFGGTITVENAWVLGFNHMAIAVGAGLPRELPVENSLSPGMRQANDFLMALQLTGAVKKSSLANLEVRLPAVVIGGGLTGVDTATEVQAYYITQVEKMHQRYHILKSQSDEEILRAQFDAQSLEILDEYLLHAECILNERELAKKENRSPKLNALIRAWGGVTIAYRKSITESPAYQRNHEELVKALEEGIYYAQGLEPVSVVLDSHGHASATTFRARVQDEIGNWIVSDELQIMPAKSIFVATGAKPNIAYEFEHRGTFEKKKDTYQSYEEKNGALNPLEIQGNVKSSPFGIFTSYQNDAHFVSFIGDTHPLFHGSVVKAIASAKRSYPKIMDALQQSKKNATTYDTFRKNIDHLFQSSVVSVKRHLDHLIEITVRAPIAAKQFHPGQFYRLQNYETHASMLGDTRLQTESIAALGVPNSDFPDQLSFFIAETGASTRLVSTFQPNEPIALMGPTGAKTKIPHQPEKIAMIGDALAIPYFLSVALAMKKIGCEIIFVLNLSEKQLFAKERILKLTDDFYFSEQLDHCIQFISQHPELKNVSQFHVIGSSELLQTIQTAKNTLLKNKYADNAAWIASVYGPMQCMLKGVCAQCLQWQIDPVTGKRTKAVYACSWQHQPMNIVDIHHIHERLNQNKTQEILTDLWLTYLMR